MNDVDKREEKLTLDLLNAINKRSDLSQRHLARQMGVALGLANSYIKRCTHKGLVKICEAPANRYLYYLTPKGFAEKARLTGQYLTNSLEFYRHAGESFSSIFKSCRDDGKERILLCGVSDLAEIALIRAQEAEIDIVGVYDPEASLELFFTKPVWSSFNKVGAFDVCLLTNISSPYESYKSIACRIEKEKILVPDVLGMIVPSGE